MDRKDKLKKMTEELVRIPSVTESARESEPAFWINGRLEKLDYFRENPQNLRLIETPLEGSRERLFALIARVDAAVPTKRTVLLISHFDVVDAHIYGELEEYAFDPTELARLLGLPGEEGALYGRGVMDMKCGVALEVDILEEFAENRLLFDVNLIAAFVGDEENSSAGMRGVLPALAALQKEGLDFLAAVNTEPGEAGVTDKTGPMLYLGTLGKLLPGFYVKGLAAHVGNCSRGYSAAQAVSSLVLEAEGNPELADSFDGAPLPSWICLDMRVIREWYSVTVPDRAYAYFNCFTATRAPGEIMGQMKKIAAAAAERVEASRGRANEVLCAAGYDEEKFAVYAAKVFTLNELAEKARERRGSDYDSELAGFIKAVPPGDMRTRGIAVVDKIAEMSGEEGPYTVCFFLPPWLPVRTDFTGDARDRAVIEAAREVSGELFDVYGLKMTEVGLFAGICDLSYVGAKVSAEDLSALESNLPGFGEIYKLSLAEMQSFGLPVINLGPSGQDAHKKTERLWLRYSLEILPELLRSLINRLSMRVS